jgi:hypothetical protein
VWPPIHKQGQGGVLVGSVEQLRHTCGEQGRCMIPADPSPPQYTRQNQSRSASHKHWLRCTALRSPGQHQRPACTMQNLEAQEPNWLEALRFDTYTSTYHRANTRQATQLGAGSPDSLQNPLGVRSEEKADISVWESARSVTIGARPPSLQKKVTVTLPDSKIQT